MKNLNDMHRHLTVHYGYAENYGKTKTDNSQDILREGFECLKEYCRDNNVSLVELFEKFDADGSMSVSLQEFQDGLKVSIRLDDNQGRNNPFISFYTELICPMSNTELSFQNKNMKM